MTRLSGLPGRRIRFSAGWGTLLTNDFRGCHPNGKNGLHPSQPDLQDDSKPTDARR